MLSAAPPSSTQASTRSFIAPYLALDPSSSSSSSSCYAPPPFSPESHASHIPLRPYTYPRTTCSVDYLAPEIVPSSRFPSKW